MAVDISEEELADLLRNALKNNPDFRAKVYEILHQEFVSHREFHEYMERSDQRFNTLLEEMRNGFAEVNRRFEAVDKRFEAVDKRFEAVDKRFEAVDKRFEAMQKQMDKRFEAVDRRFEQLLHAMEEGFKTMDRRLTSLGARWGYESEGAFRAAMKGVLTKHFGATVNNWCVFDEDGIVYGHPSQVEVDVAIRNDQPILIEVKASVSRGDVAELYRIGELYRQKEHTEPSLAMVSPYFRPGAPELAAKLDIEVYID